jgi:hypothetical protein
VNRAAECIQRLGDKSATLPLINALVTEHKYQIPQGGAPGSINPTFGSGAGGSSPGGGLSMGGKPQITKQQRQNASVRTALTSLHPGVNFQFNIDEWLNWYTQSQTSNNVDLRREE